MASIKVFGNTITVTSEVSLEDLKLVSRERPEALTIWDGEDPVFTVGLSNDRRGSLTRFGALFPKKTADQLGRAVITIDMPEVESAEDGYVDTATIRKTAAKAVGKGIIYLNRVEEKLPGVIEELLREENEILNLIQVL